MFAEAVLSVSNAELKVSKNGNPYLSVETFQKTDNMAIFEGHPVPDRVNFVVFGEKAEKNAHLRCGDTIKVSIKAKEYEVDNISLINEEDVFGG